jgi:putative transposase
MEREVPWKEEKRRRAIPMGQQPYRKDAYNRIAYIESFKHITLRLPNHDYSGPGVYHVVNCAKGIGGRGPLFEHPTLRKILQVRWLDLQDRFPTLQLDAFTIMPDHLHFLIWPNKWPDRTEKPPALWEIIREYKSGAFHDWLHYVERCHPDWSAKIWQRKYYERFVRINELDSTRRYIRENPTVPDHVYKKWAG